jgi:hypothetical protein
VTKETDIPVPITALAARFHSRFNGTYLAGLWREDLILDLLWYTLYPRCVASFFAPSWSWMSLEADGSSYHFRDVHNMGADAQYLVEVTEEESTPSTLNPFRSVSSGRITLAGILILDCTIETTYPKLRLPLKSRCSVVTHIDSHIYCGSAQLEDRGVTTITRRALRHEPNHKFSFTVTALPLAVDSDDRYISGLILGRSPRHPGAFERLGIFTYLTREAFKDAKRDHGVREIVLV